MQIKGGKLYTKILYKLSDYYPNKARVNKTLSISLTTTKFYLNDHPISMSIKYIRPLPQLL